MNKEEILNKLNHYNLDKQNIIIIGSAALVLKNIKETCQDIDIAVTKEYNDYLLKKFDCKLEQIIDDHKVYFIDNITYEKVYHKPLINEYVFPNRF